MVEDAIEEAELVATSVVAYAEARAALARKLREGVFSVEEHREAVAALDGDWETFERLDVTEDLTHAAGGLAEEHALRGFDAIHLASALLISAALFLSFDARLTDAAREVMDVYESSSGSPD